jgi:four helix bundle protein
LGCLGVQSSQQIFPRLAESKLEANMGRSYRELVAWKKAMLLVTEIYWATKSFPIEERYGLTNQLRRAAVSIPSNIAEGQARFSAKDFHRFLSTARGSLVEVETQVEIAKNLGYLSDVQSATLSQSTAELGRVLNGLISSIKSAA